MDIYILSVCEYLFSILNSEIISLIMLFIAFASMLFAWRIWGKVGLFTYNIVAVIIANIQVLKTTSFMFSEAQIALGTIIFATTFVASDIITEHHGVKDAKTSIMLSIFAQILVSILMLLTLLYPTNSSFSGLSSDGAIQNSIQNSMYNIFLPSVRILTASIIAYYISQICDIYIFKYLKSITSKRFLWIRLNVSNIISALIDNILFSVLAWKIMSPYYISNEDLLFTYILGTMGSRIIVSLISTPVIYLSYYKK